MSGKLNRRLAKIEQAVSKMARQEILADCNCRDVNEIFLGDDAKIEAELNLTCPVHAERRLGRWLNFDIVAEGRRVPNPRRDLLVENYNRRYARQLEQMVEK